MRKLISFALLLTLVASCTKEVPESEKRLAKSTSEKEIGVIIENFSEAYNSGDIDKISSYLSIDYSGFVQDSDSAINMNTYLNELKNLRKQHPESKLQLKIEEVNVSEELAAVRTFGSYMVPDPIEGKMNPVYSERSIKLLHKVKNEGWKIFRSLSIPAFSYE